MAGRAIGDSGSAAQDKPGVLRTEPSTPTPGQTIQLGRIRRQGGRFGGRSIGPVSGRIGRHGPCGRVILRAFRGVQAVTVVPLVARSLRGSRRASPRGDWEWLVSRLFPG